MTDLDARIAAKIHRTASGCLHWDGSCMGTTAHPVPTSSLKGNPVSVRHYLWEQRNGAVPDGKILRLTCADIRCVDPRHMRMLTRSELSLQVNATSGRCRSGRHDLTDETNVRRDRNGRRNGCVPCLREKQRAYSAAEVADGRAAARRRRAIVPDAAA